MLSLAARIRPTWAVVTLLVSDALLTGAHAFERFGGLEPCPLCLDQREWHWGVVALSLAVLLLARIRPALLRWGIAAIGIVLLGSVGQAAHHVAVEQGWLIAQCDAQVDLNNLSLDPNASFSAPKCDEIAWSLFGVSMAGYNALVSLLMALASFVVAAASERKA